MAASTGADFAPAHGAGAVVSPGNVTELVLVAEAPCASESPPRTGKIPIFRALSILRC